MATIRRLGLLALAPVMALALLAEPALAQVAVTRAEVIGLRLRIDGTALAARDITVDGVVLGRSDASGVFRIERDPYLAPADCTVDLNDGGPTVTAARLVGCTISSPPAPDTTAPTVPAGLTTTVVGSTVGLTWSPSTDGTAVTGYRVTRNGVSRGTTNDTTFSDTGLAAGTYTYTVAAFDAAGNTSLQSAAASATVTAAEALAFLTPSQLPDAVLGQPYLGYLVASDPPGPSTFRFKVVAGRVPAGTQFVENTLPSRPEARVVGTPTAVGTSTFTVEVRDNTGAVARRSFSLRVLAG